MRDGFSIYRVDPSNLAPHGTQWAVHAGDPKQYMPGVISYEEHDEPGNHYYTFKVKASHVSYVDGYTGERDDRQAEAGRVQEEGF